MSNSEIQGTKLVELYHRYVGEPESKRDVYGYWLFLLGSIAGMAGVAVFQVEQLLFAGNFQVRESAIVLAAAVDLLSDDLRDVLAAVDDAGGTASMAMLGETAFCLGDGLSAAGYDPEVCAVHSAGAVLR